MKFQPYKKGGGPKRISNPEQRGVTKSVGVPVPQLSDYLGRPTHQCSKNAKLGGGGGLSRV